MNQRQGTVHHLSDQDIYFFREGRHHQLYQKLGAHLDPQEGVSFAVWAPSATTVSVVGTFNGWDRAANLLDVRWDSSGIWEGVVPEAKKGDLYKYHISNQDIGFESDKGDPFALYWETPPRSASIVWDLAYDWHDQEWMDSRHQNNRLSSPISIYEMHLGSWSSPNSYRDLAPRLADYVGQMGFTHVELLPIMEHPFYGSWGYQTLGYFAPSSRFGTPQDFMYLIDLLHQRGIAVLLDWVPSHFPNDSYGLARFDGTCLFEHSDPKQGFHPDWKSAIFNYGRHEVRSFLSSSALFWLDQYHVDGLRVDAVASMLYLDYSREPGEWVPNPVGGRENLDAIEFLRELNKTIYARHPSSQTVAEESTAWPSVSRPIEVGGLGFGMKWKMGWMHDTLNYFSRDPLYRKYHHNEITFSLWYAFSENFVLPLSHDEVVHGKGSLLSKMPGDDWQAFANLRLLFGYMFGHPGKKLLFMGCELGQRREWSHDSFLDWALLEYPSHRGLQRWVADLNRLYTQEKALYELDFDPSGFEWIDYRDADQSVVSFLRKGQDPARPVLVVCNFTPEPREGYVIGVPLAGQWEELLNSDAEPYGGSGMGNRGNVVTSSTGYHGHAQSLCLTIAPLATHFLKPKA